MPSKTALPSKGVEVAVSAPPLLQVVQAFFFDPRSGKDRRDTRGQANDPRRVNGERRRMKSNTTWWLEKNYVDAHQFLVTPPGNKGGDQE